VHKITCYLSHHLQVVLRLFVCVLRVMHPPKDSSDMDYARIYDSIPPSQTFHFPLFRCPTMSHTVVQRSHPRAFT
jgi:hypothetical protein